MVRCLEGVLSGVASARKGCGKGLSVLGSEVGVARGGQGKEGA
jgi:hypothetical protein